jgi:hypothetical protein
MNDLRGNRPLNGFGQQQPSPVQAVTNALKPAKEGKTGKRGFMNISYGLLLVSITLVLVGLVAFLVVGDDKKVSEASFIDTGKYQAVFIGSEDPQNLSRTYFGHLREIDNDTFVLTDVFVALEGTTGTGDNAAKTAVLDKIGCGPIQGPVETIYLSKKTVAFWINLRDDSKLARSISQYKEQYTKPIECDENGANKNAPTAATPTPTPSTQQ